MLSLTYQLENIAVSCSVSLTNTMEHAHMFEYAYMVVVVCFLVQWWNIERIFSGLEHSVKSLQKQMDSWKKASKALDGIGSEIFQRGIRLAANCPGICWSVNGSFLGRKDAAWAWR